jgi:hypothetical protein
MPRPSLQVAILESIEQQLRLVEPRGVDRGKAIPPPAIASRQIVPRLGTRVARVVIVDQVDSTQMTVPMPESSQHSDVMFGVLCVDTCRLHPTAVNDEKDQDVDRAVSRVLELALFDRAGDRTADRIPFQDLKVGLFIGTDCPEACSTNRSALA